LHIFFHKYFHRWCFDALTIADLQEAGEKVGGKKMQSRKKKSKESGKEWEKKGKGNTFRPSSVRFEGTEGSFR